MCFYRLFLLSFFFFACFFLSCFFLFCFFLSCFFLSCFFLSCFFLSAYFLFLRLLFKYPGYIAFHNILYIQSVQHAQLLEILLRELHCLRIRDIQVFILFLFQFDVGKHRALKEHIQDEAVI